MSHNDSLRRKCARRTIDLAVREVLDEFGGDQRARRAFEGLLLAVRSESVLLKPLDGGAASFEEPIFVLRGLYSLVLHRRDWIRSPDEWRADESSRRLMFSSLVHCLLAERPVPAFMLPVWFLERSATARKQQTWYKHLARGCNIRGASVPHRLTKKMAHCFMQAPDHYSLDEAFRWACSCRTRQQRTCSPNRQVSCRRLKKQVGKCGRFGRESDWTPIPIRGFRVVDPEKRDWSFRSWSVSQILSSSVLREEGDALYHCVACYESWCRRGETSIWSMMTHGTLTSRHVLTIEVNPQSRRIVQARGRCNFAPTPEARRVLLKWADREGLDVASSI
jgi:hypothetical protein